MSGWLINVERDVTLDPRVPGFFAAYELTERTTTWLDCVQGLVHLVALASLVLGPLVLALLYFVPGLARQLMRLLGRRGLPAAAEGEGEGEGEGLGEGEGEGGAAAAHDAE